MSKVNRTIRELVDRHGLVVVLEHLHDVLLDVATDLDDARVDPADVRQWELVAKHIDAMLEDTNVQTAKIPATAAS